MSWDNGQIAAFAKQFALQHRPCWPAYVPDVREAMIDSFAMSIVLGQYADHITISEIRSLRMRLGVMLGSQRFRMSNPIAEQAASIERAEAVHAR